MVVGGRRDRKQTLKSAVLSIERLPEAKIDVQLMSDLDYRRTSSVHNVADSLLVSSLDGEVRNSSLTALDSLKDKTVGNGGIVD